MKLNFGLEEDEEEKISYILVVGRIERECVLLKLKCG